MESMERVVPLDLYVIRMGLDVKFPAFSVNFSGFNGAKTGLFRFERPLRKA